MPISVSHIFNRKMLNAALERVDIMQVENIQRKQQILAKWKQTIDSNTLNHVGEMSLHGMFLSDLFSTVNVFL